MGNSDKIFRVEVRAKEAKNHGGHLAAVSQLNIPDVERIEEEKLFFLKGTLSQADAEQIANDLLADPVTETFVILSADVSSPSPHTIIEASPLPGVTDPPAENLLKAAHMLGVTSLKQAATGSRFIIFGAPNEDALNRLATEILSNLVVQQASINKPITAPFVVTETSKGLVETISLTEANDYDLTLISRERRLSLDLNEMKAIRAYYQAEKREPTDVELEMLAQTWSEHCVHKTFRATIDYTDHNGKTEIINGLLNTYIRAATEKVNKPWVLSAFVDDAGIIEFDENFDIAFKVETHNHPSALEPFGGANTGVGGVMRDVLGVSARPIANTDILCFGPPDLSADSLPEGVLHPSRIADGVIAGIEDYGNKMGVPTVNGAIFYDNGYTANPLVYCGCLGVLPHGKHPVGANAGDLIVALGGRTGRDGLRGATFSSMEMDTSTSEIAGSSVQIGHPIMEKQVLEVLLRARDEELYTAITDCGAGGFSSSIGEMAEEVGARVQLANAPLKYPGLEPWEIWLSEAQERMVIAVPLDKLERVKELAKGQDVEATILGEFTGDKRIQLFYNEDLVGDLSMAFLFDGIPQRRMTAEWKGGSGKGETTANAKRPAPNAEATLLKLLAHHNIRSKESTVRLYDHEVQGGTAIKPFVGVANQGPSDAAVIVPMDTQLTANGQQPTAVKGVSLSNGINPELGKVDPYAMAWSAIDEAIRNAVAVGADPDKIAILDNFCWGNPNLPDRLGALVRCSQGCYDAAVAYGTPFVSGKDSLNNEYTGADGEKHAIPGTILISAMGIVPDVNKAVTMDLKSTGSALIMVGENSGELGGSHFNLITDDAGNMTPPAALPNGLTTFRAMHRAINAGLIRACHDLSEGGLAVSLAEMAFAGRLGATVSLDRLPQTADLSDNELLFGESNGRFLIEVAPENIEFVTSILYQVPHALVGTVQAEPTVTIFGKDGGVVVKSAVSTLETAWRGEVAPVHKSPISQSPSLQSPNILTKSPKILIMHANGTNRDRDAALACKLAGGEPEIVHINQLISGDRALLDYSMLVVPGGFSYGDDLGAGVIWSTYLQHQIGTDLEKFVSSGRPTIGICNGFQTLVKAGLLPSGVQPRDVTLTYNQQDHFECRWVYLEPNQNSNSLFIKGLNEPIYCPVAHGEGRFIGAIDDSLIALRYMQPTANGQLPTTSYPFNPNGSVESIAGITNAAGNVLGLMPHPEDHIFPWQHPRHTRGERGLLGLSLFENGIKNC